MSMSILNVSLMTNYQAAEFKGVLELVCEDRFRQPINDHGSKPLRGETVPKFMNDSNPQNTHANFDVDLCCTMVKIKM